MPFRPVLSRLKTRLARLIDAGASLQRTSVSASALYGHILTARHRTGTLMPGQVADVHIGDRVVGSARPCFITAETAVNHNGAVAIATRLILAAVLAGCDAVTFQKRTPELCVPAGQRGLLRDTPWGRTTYLEYRQRIELSEDAYADIDAWCRLHGITWFASCWDEPSVDFVERSGPPCHKIASACLTNDSLLRSAYATSRPVMLSTGMSSLDEIRRAAAILDRGPLLIAQSTSAYPCPPQDVNLLTMESLRAEFGCPVGYSGHESGTVATLAAVALGASFLERHITLDRSRWGSDHSCSLEPGALADLVRDIRIVERARGDGIRRLCDSERPATERLRRAA